MLGDWYASLIHARPQLVVCMSERTLLVTLIPARDIKLISDRFRAAVSAQLQRIGVPAVAVEAEMLAMSELRFAATANRRVLGCLREATFALELELKHPRYSSLTEIEDFLGTNIYSTTEYRRPRELALELLNAQHQK
ncbi:MAG TPA: hypothetical protein VMN03_14680 [Burkholderiales bacterium]|nr:hypothetical protein [Burkholderiales bacterium]